LADSPIDFHKWKKEIHISLEEICISLFHLCIALAEICISLSDLRISGGEIGNPSCPLCHDPVEGQSNDSGLEFEEEALRRDGVEVLWHLSVEEAKGGFHLLLMQLVEVDQTGSERLFGIRSGQRHKTHLGCVLQEPLFVLICVGFVAKERGAFGEFQSHLLQTVKIRQSATTQKELHQLAFGCDQ